MGLSRRSSAFARIGAFAVIAALAAALALPAAASAATATFSGRAPSPGASITIVTPKIAVSAFARSGVRGTNSFSLKVDGVKVAAKLSYAVRGDYRRFTVSYRSAALSAGRHRVALTVRDRKGHSITTSWTFTVRTSPQSVGPLLVSPIVAAPTAASDIEPSYVGTATIHLYPVPGGRAFYRLDGGPVVAGDVVVVAPPASGSVDHTLYFLLADAAGNAGTPLTAAFVVSAPPALDTVAPVTVLDWSGTQPVEADVYLAASDDSAGPITTYWRVNDGELHEGTAVLFPEPESWGLVTYAVEFWSVDAAGNEELPHNSESYSLLIDPPVLPDIFPPTTSSDLLSFYVGNAVIHLYPMDRSAQPMPQVIGAGVASTYYSIDGEAPREVHGALGQGVTVIVRGADVDTAHTIEYWSVDEKGNVEDATSGSFTIVPRWDLKPSYVGTATIELTPPYDGKFYYIQPLAEYSLDGAQWSHARQLVVSPPLFGADEHRIAVMGTDEFGFYGPVVGEFTVEASPQDTPASHLVDNNCTRSGCHEPDVTRTHQRYGCTVCHGAAASATFDCDSCHDIETLWDTHDFQPPLTSSDAVTHYVGAATIRIWSMDRAPWPIAQVLGSGVATTYWRLDDGETHAVTQLSNGIVVNVPGPPAGIEPHTLEYWSVDTLGNAEWLHGEKTFTIESDAPPADVTAPVTTIDYSGAQGVDADMFLAATDDTPGPIATYWRIAPGEAEQGTAVNLPTSHEWGAGRVVWTVEYWSVDAAGNEELPHHTKTFEFFYAKPPCAGSGCHLASVITAHGCQTCHAAGVVATFDCESCHPAEELGEPHDFLPPNSSCDAVGAYTGSATIKIWAMDRSNSPIAQVIGAGIATTYWRLDDGPVQQATPPLGNGVSVVVPGPASGAEEHTLEYWSEDAHGNVEWFHKTADFVVGAPLGTPWTDMQQSYVGTATIHIVVPGASHIYTQLDSGPVREGGTVVVAPPAAGSAMHALSYWCVDSVGNLEPKRLAYFTVSAPDVPATYTFDDVRPSNPATVTVANPTVRVAVHGGTQSIAGATATLDGQPVTPTIAYYRFIALLPGNGGDGSRTSVSPDTMTAAIYYTVGPDYTQAFVTIPASNLTTGIHVVTVTPAGSTQTKTWTFAVALPDRVAPVTTSNARSSYAGTATVTLTAVDDTSGTAHTYWRLDGGAVHEGTVAVVPAPADPEETASHSLEFWSVDWAGNVETHKTVTFLVEYNYPLHVYGASQ